MGRALNAETARGRKGAGGRFVIWEKSRVLVFDADHDVGGLNDRVGLAPTLRPRFFAEVVVMEETIFSPAAVSIMTSVETGAFLDFKTPQPPACRPFSAGSG